MNKIKLSNRGKIIVASICFLLFILGIGIFGELNHKPSTNLPTTTISPSNNTPSSSNDTSNYEAKVNSIISRANSISNDVNTVSGQLANGAIDINTAISRLQNDKKRADNLISEIQSLNPPQNMQHVHSLLISAFQDFDNSISLEISGLQNSNVNQIQRSIDLTNSAVSKFNQAKNEANQLT